jgi:hypothetical protein
MGYSTAVYCMMKLIDDIAVCGGEDACLLQQVYPQHIVTKLTSKKVRTSIWNLHEGSFVSMNVVWIVQDRYRLLQVIKQQFYL